MRTLASGCLAALLLVRPVAALAPQTEPPQATPEKPPFEPSVRLIYESDTRAYYRPCG